MTPQDIIMAGFGGQGVLLSGKLLASAAMDEGRQVSWLPSYGPEMRGGTANVTVCISDLPIGSPLVARPTMLLVMNQPSLEKFGLALLQGGIAVINSSLIPITLERNDVTVLYLNAGEMAERAGAARAANIAMLGALVGISDVVSREQCLKTIEQEFQKKPKFIPINLAVFDAGYEEGKKKRSAL
jgi:2-oxoglutarate ferredoxin oxidoreductase subunit gamma